VALILNPDEITMIANDYAAQPTNTII